MKTIRNIIYAAFALLLASFALLPQTQALLPPPQPDGGYPNQNTAEGDHALYNLNNGDSNTAVGDHALFSLTDARHNTAIGLNTLYSLTNGYANTAVGSYALSNNTTGTFNTAIGFFALSSLTNGYANTAVGSSALSNNTTGVQNTATGELALSGNTTAKNNTADGFQALLNNTTGAQNTATGESALKHNSTANNNTADGFQALFQNTTGAKNTAVGQHALFNNNTGSFNIAVGANAGSNLTIGSNNIEIGSAGVNGESNTIRIGTAQTRTFIKGISGAVVAGAQVVVNAGGELGVAASSARFKTEIKPMDKASEAIFALKPVTFRYKKGIDPKAIPQFGLVAEEVEKVNPDLVVRDMEGKPYTVRYDAVNAMLLNQFLKEHKAFVEGQRKVQEQGVTIAQLQKQVETLTAGLQKVSTQLELVKTAPQTVLNNQ